MITYIMCLCIEKGGVEQTKPERIGGVPEEASARITALRFPLAVLVVFIHNNYSAESVAEAFGKIGVMNPFAQNGFGRWIQLSISEGIACCAVPLFFLFAAFLQASKNAPYGTLLKKKAKSLALPYALWMAVYAVYYGIGKLAVARIAPHLLDRPDDTVLSWTAHDWFAKLFGFGEFAPTEDLRNPAFAAQFWFVRDLLILTIASPAITAVVRKFPAGFFALASTVYLLALPVWFVSTQAFFFYTAGLSWGMYGFDLFGKTDRVTWSEACVLFIAAFCLQNTLFAGSGGSCHQLMVVFACVLALKASSLIVRRETLFSVARTLAPLSFFLFAAHQPVVLGVMQKIWLAVFPMKNTFFSLFEYFGVTILVVVLCTAAGFALRKTCPPAFRLFNGGRG